MLGELEQAEELLLAARARQAQRALTKDIHDGLISGRLLHRKGSCWRPSKPGMKHESGESNQFFPIFFALAVESLAILCTTSSTQMLADRRRDDMLSLTRLIADQRAARGRSEHSERYSGELQLTGPRAISQPSRQ